MALSFLKKIAAKLLGGSSEKSAQDPARTAKKRESQQPTSTRTAKPHNKGASAERKSKSWVDRTQRTSSSTSQSSDGPQRREPKPRQDRKPRQQPYEGRDTTKQHRPNEDRPLSSPVTGGRSTARPERMRRPERGTQSRPENTAAHAMRPGGAITDAETERRKAEHAAWDPSSFQVPEAEGKRRFQDLNLPVEILHAIAEKGFQYCTPIQALSLDHALAGKNVAGKAQTGTGKTAAFLVAILTRYLRTPEARAEKGGRPRALVIAPTRELVIQICKDADVLGKYCGLRCLAVYGGMDYERQKREVMDAPVDLLVATPGRLLDFVRSRVVDLSKVDTLVIDEADRMLDMGFIPDVRSIVNRLPPKEQRCTMLYSATLSDDVMRLARQWMEEPVSVEVESEQVTTKTVKQVVYVVTSNEKFTVLYNHIQQYPDSRILIFCNRKSTTDDVAESLARRGIRCEVLSGDVNQNRRLRVLEDFREGKVRIVVATDVAGRGLHVDDIGFVINFDFPYAAEDYVHRIGRTGRAGQSGVAISFADEDESFTIPEIEKYIGEELKCTLLRDDDPLLVKIPHPRRSHHVAHEAASDGQPSQEQEPSSAPAAAQDRVTPAPVAAEATAPDPAAEPAKTVPAVTASPTAERTEPSHVEQPTRAAAVSEEAPVQRTEPNVEKREQPPRVSDERTPAHHHREHSPRPAARQESRPQPPPPPASGTTPQQPSQQRRSRFSEEWVPGQN